MPTGLGSSNGYVLEPFPKTKQGQGSTGRKRIASHLHVRVRCKVGSERIGPATLLGVRESSNT